MILSMAGGIPSNFLILLVCTMAVPVLSKPGSPSSPDDSHDTYPPWAHIQDVDFPKNGYGGSDQDGAGYRSGGGYDDSDRVKDWMERVNSEPSGWGEYLNQRRRDSEMMPQGPRRASHRANNENSRHPFDTASGGGEGGYRGGYGGGCGGGNEGGFGGGYGGGNEGGNEGGYGGGYGGGHQSGGGYWGDSRTGYADWARGNRH